MTKPAEPVHVTESVHTVESDANLSSSPETLIADDEAVEVSPIEEERNGDAGSLPVTPKKDSAAAKKKKKSISHKRLPLRNVLLSAGEIKDVATKLYNEKFVLISPEEYTQFLAAQDPDSTAIRECYMSLFEWDASLIKATRKLCLKLYLKGESQEIDRLLSAFTKSYLKQHPVNVFCTQDFEQIYIVLYSLILLNTSLHNSEVSKKSKLSQSDYIRNTLTTFLLQNLKVSRALSVKQKIQIERELNGYYEDLAKKELYLKKGDPDTPKKDTNTNRYSVAETIRSSVSGNHADYSFETGTASPLAHRLVEVSELSRQPSSTSNWSVDAEAKHRPSLAMKRMTSMASTGTTESTAASYAHSNSNASGSGSRFGFTRALLSDSSQRAGANALRNHKSTEQLRNLTRRSSRVSISTKESMFTQQAVSDDEFSIASLGDMPQLNISNTYDQEQYRLENFDVADFQDPLDLKLELQGAPYLKEGLLKLRILNNDLADQSSSGEANVSSAALALSVLSTSKGGFFSFFMRSANKETPPPTTLGTNNNNNVFSSKLTEYFVVVSKGELRLYSFDPKVIKKQQQKLKKVKQKQPFFGLEGIAEEEEDIGDGNWLNNAAHIGNYNLCSTIAQLEKTSGNQLSASAPNKVVFSLSFPRVSKKAPKKFVFEAGTVEVANEFINTCNFWASKLTAVPTLEESMSSIEYGWNDLESLKKLGDGFKKTKSISKWESLPKGVYLSNLSMSNPSDESDTSNHEGMLKQFVLTLKYYNNLKNLFNSFNRQKSQFMKQFRKFSNTSNYKLVMTNYDNRAQEYKSELGKYKSYITMLGFGLKLRFDLEQEDQMIYWAEEILELPDMDSPEEIADELSRRTQEAADNESELTKAVKLELERLSQTSSSMKKLIAESLAAENLEENVPENTSKKSDGTQDKSEDPSNPALVKSPKNFSLSHFKESSVSSPVSQLLSADKTAVLKDQKEPSPIQKELAMSYSTSTIREEVEPEEFEDAQNKRR